jgi:phosphoribosylaminoimidazole (AIR) synthetase
MVPDDLCALVTKDSLPLPPIVRYFRENGASMDAMYEAFNMGVGFTITVKVDKAIEIVEYINQHFKDSVPDVERKAKVIGMIAPGVDDAKFEYVDI